LPDDGVALEEIERQAIRRALDRCEGNVSQAARFLRISRQTLIYRMKKHGIGSPPDRD
jgi:two-component system NtrC family response regulator